jgi:hypothetical protein
MPGNRKIRFVRWYLARGANFKSAGTAIWFAGVFALSAKAEQWVQNKASGDYKTALIFAATVLVLVFSIMLRGWAQSVINLDASNNATLAYARQLMDRYVSGRIALYPSRYSLDSTSSIEGARQRLMDIVQHCYAVFEGKYGTSDDYNKRLNFEISFMTKSYIDNEVTIASYANRGSSRPPSLTDRATNKFQYSKTFAAEVYRDNRRELMIIEDTSAPASRFHEVYTRQRDRIKSMLVSPVLDHNNNVLGALVVHVESLASSWTASAASGPHCWTSSGNASRWKNSDSIKRSQWRVALRRSR